MSDENARGSLSRRGRVYGEEGRRGKEALSGLLSGLLTSAKVKSKVKTLLLVFFYLNREQLQPLD